jgi:deoxyribonuclease-4
MRIAIEHIIEEMKNNNIKAKIIIETPAGQGTELLTNLNEFIDFYNSFSKEQKKYLGICLDTAHIWASNYELNEAYNIICNKNANDLIVIHLNNSVVKKGSNVDRHAPIFDSANGTIPITAIKEFIELFKDNKHVPIIILETPSIEYSQEIKWIYANI